MARRASIDIGTNTVRLLIADVDNNNKINPIHIERRITRLGGGYTEEFGISDDAMTRTVDALVDFRTLLDKHDVTDVNAIATSAARRAINKGKFLRDAKEKARIDIDIIDGDLEATLSAAGVLSVVHDIAGKSIIMDIGGGSTEFVLLDANTILGRWSMEFGVVYITEHYLKSAPAKAEELQNAKAYILDNLEALNKRIIKDLGLDDISQVKVDNIIGTAGTVTTIAAIDMDMEEYDPGKINNHAMSEDAIIKIFHNLATLTLPEREQILALEKGREDLIIAGVLILMSVMDNFSLKNLIVSDSGLLEGILIKKK